jgi:hypothetical protein
MRRGLLLVLATAFVVSGCDALFGVDFGDGHPQAEDGGSASADAPSVEPDGGLLLFGGATAHEPFGDTWTWNGAAWTEQHPPSPPTARLGALVETLSSGTYLFGGASVPTAYGNFDGDTWKWAHGTWTPMQVTPSPSARLGTAHAVLNGEVVVFGGCGPPLLNPLGDTWTWDGTMWTPRIGAGPSARCGAGAAAMGGGIIVFGGGDDHQAFDETWQWDGSAWTQRMPAHHPTPRYDAMMMPIGGNILLFGGGYPGQGQVFQDTWVWDGNDWTQMTPQHQPPSRWYAAAGTWTNTATALLFGGCYGNIDDAGVFGDTWLWTGSDWTEVAVPGPSPRCGASMGPL